MFGKAYRKSVPEEREDIMRYIITEGSKMGFNVEFADLSPFATMGYVVYTDRLRVNKKLLDSESNISRLSDRTIKMGLKYILWHERGHWGDKSYPGSAELNERAWDYAVRKYNEGARYMSPDCYFILSNSDDEPVANLYATVKIMEENLDPIEAIAAAFIIKHLHGYDKKDVADEKLYGEDDCFRFLTPVAKERIRKRYFQLLRKNPS